MTTLVINQRMAELADGQVTFWKVSPKWRSFTQVRPPIHTNPFKAMFDALRWVVFGKLPHIN